MRACSRLNFFHRKESERILGETNGAVTSPPIKRFQLFFRSAGYALLFLTALGSQYAIVFVLVSPRPLMMMAARCRKLHRFLGQPPH